MLIAAAAGAIVLGVLYQRARAEVVLLASEVGRLEEAALSEASPSAPTEEARLVAARLRLALDSGASSAFPPTALLRLVETALPGEVLLTRLSFGSSPSPSLTLEASAASGDRVTELQRRLAGSPLVSTTSLLEERRLPDGRLAIRVQVAVERK
jgi:hypothetical protein